MWEADSPPPDINRVLAQLYGPNGAGKVGERVLGVKPEVARQLVQPSSKLVVDGNSCTILFSVRVRPDKTGARPAAREFADALVEQLGAFLLESRRVEAAVRLGPVKDELRELDLSMEALRRRIRDKAAKLYAEAGRADLSTSNLQGGAGKLEDERQRLELDLAGMEARHEAVQEQIQEVTKRVKTEGADDPVLVELEKAVAARQKAVDLQRKLYESGQAGFSEVSNAEALLIEARVQMLDRRGTASARGADLLAPLTREMQTLGIEIRDRKARLRHVEQRIKPLQDAAREFMELKWMEDEESMHRRRWEEANIRVRDALRVTDASPVDRVIVTSATDGAAPAEAAPQK